MSANDPGDLHRLFIDAVNAHDLDAVMALFEPDPVGVDLDGNTLHGGAAMREFLGGFLSVTRRLEGQTRKVILAGDLALISSNWRAVIATPAGSSVTSEGTTAEVARRQADGTWRFLIDDPQFLHESVSEAKS
ncbi:conserved hypothetical protein [Amycolatopsis lurida]|uniref:SnoaL-like domain-containing protein n=1 Tax=Amycolatopsis lurida NRRL 2430 TaxID=1460371 RepID=A0A2P2FGF6_AMYLU|nr:SgcJ/EcaC family oxidoreductase [Amycolatopsis lurida]KFU75801.1 hypothetical protein BB31_39565 [Amycolatopsis lurida NRRL 2430]SEE28044.1 conserved hypothetical protein [Amycolatopsis lurida]